MVELWPAVEQFFTVLVTLLYQVVLLLYQLVLLIGVLFQHGALLIVWLLWWLLGVNWKQAWPVLARGAWAPVVLVMLASALVWSQLAPSSGTFLGAGTFPNFWWQLGDICLLVGLALFCGWLQGVIGWAPAEISLQPPVPSDEHIQAHAHH